MINQFKSLLWLRREYLLSNKIALFVCVISPIIDVYLLGLLPPPPGGDRLSVLFMGTGMVYSLTSGSLVAMILGDEKEKNNLRTLILAGVGEFEYIISLIFHPLLLSFISCMIIPWFFNIKIYSLLTYGVVVFLTCISFILINLAIGFWTKTQVQATSISLFFFIIALFFPMLSSEIPIIEQITNYSFLGANTAYFNNPLTFSLRDRTVIVLIIWNLLIGISLRWAYMINIKKR